MEKFNVSASPHIRSQFTTSNIMLDVVIALIPASAFGVYQFGFRALLVLLAAIASAVLSEYWYERFIRKRKTVYECSAVVTGLLIGMNMPASVPLWMPIIGSIFAIIVVKELFGGLGQNFMNPALGGRCFLLICFPAAMNNFAVSTAEQAQAASKAFYIFNNGAAAVDGLSSATPLAVLKAGDKVNLFDMFFGFTGGVIGETSAGLLLIGGIYLVFRKVISLRIPVSYIVTFAVFMLLFGGQSFNLEYVAAEICGGGLMLGAFFMATDYVTSPITKAGQIVFGIVLGIITGIFRVFGNSPEGVSYAIIFSNLLVPVIEKATMPKPFGKGSKAYAGK